MRRKTKIRQTLETIMIINIYDDIRNRWNKFMEDSRGKVINSDNILDIIFNNSFLKMNSNSKERIKRLFETREERLSFCEAQVLLTICRFIYRASPVAYNCVVSPRRSKWFISQFANFYYNDDKKNQRRADNYRELLDEIVKQLKNKES